MIGHRIACFTFALIFSGQVSATDKDITNPERLRTMGTLIRSVGYACTPMTVFDRGMINGKLFYRIKFKDGQRYMIATPPEGTIDDIDITGAAYIAIDDLDWQKNEWMDTITRNTESLDKISKSYPGILE